MDICAEEMGNNCVDPVMLVGDVKAVVSQVSLLLYIYVD